jgi:hypothetical protein
VIPSGVLVNVHVPAAGKPLNVTLPVATEHVGCVIVPTTGGVGVDGLALMTTLDDDGDVHVEAFVTVKVYVPDGMPVIVVLVPVPVVVVPPGVLVTVHVPVEGKPFRMTLPLPTSHVGWVIVPAAGAVGVAGWIFMITSAEEVDVHPEALVTV